ncbi:hypothetical protein ASPZODRAFT_129560 [Penicilliopsis zonata CBS 506.65]|uniref:Kinesin motor domain-containing protein n=1 Tax=Penicilliopsis zonata CBS 506.65 TaxID=1073090 RepID=A0A1L9SQ19_9EURO|nr:hypothetical protein ASPZODRAFT_129560 [Penicilliopsis zonata CBS 506.65]OJJ49157.1 hypothetical protein ASPZODRAFT_129560 [Penicilliopsis zonata CBS 506.65]
MSVRVVARVRPLLKAERELDVIVQTGPSRVENLCKPDVGAASGKKGALAALCDRSTVVRIPNPKNETEEYSFQFNAVYDATIAQQELFDAEVAPTIKHLFNGFDVTLFAYGVTGTGKTHTMRGGKSLAERGVIPRLLSGIYRRSRKIEKDSEGATTVEVSLSYYEIYNDKVFDLFEPPEKRTLAGLPLRDNGGKTVVVGLTERPCTSLKEFESLYDQANTNRSTSATKLNAHSSRSHAILCVKVTITTEEKIRVSTASAIDLAGSEDNRRTDNDKERMVESASINKSLFVLAQCVEAISKKQQRIPYRESKMTRILSLGQNNGLTLMILNLAPIRSYHLDTLSSLNFANRTKKIEVREIENEPMFKGPARPAMRPSAVSQRQPLRPLTASVNVNIAPTVAKDKDPGKPGDGKPVKAFHVFSDRSQTKHNVPSKKVESFKRPSLSSEIPGPPGSRPHKTLVRPQDPSSYHTRTNPDISAAKIEEMVEKKVEEILAARALSEQSRQAQVHEINEQMQRRLELLEQRIEGSEDARAEGLSYLLMAKQHQGRGEDHSALKMYQLALPFFPNNEKLAAKISKLQDRLKKPSSKSGLMATVTTLADSAAPPSPPTIRRPLGSMLSLKKEQNSVPRHSNKRPADESNDYTEQNDRSFVPSSDDDDGDSDSYSRLRLKKRARTKFCASDDGDTEVPGVTDHATAAATSPRTTHLLHVINSRDISQIKLLKGVGAKKAEAIVDCLCEMDSISSSGNVYDSEQPDERAHVRSLLELSRLRGVGLRTVESMRNGVLV